MLNALDLNNSIIKADSASAADVHLRGSFSEAGRQTAGLQHLAAGVEIILPYALSGGAFSCPRKPSDAFYFS